MDPETLSYDEQAKDFDERVGLSEQAARQVAEAVLERGLSDPASRVLEIGAGTGELGLWLGTAHAYTGIDTSQAMLDEFHKRLSRTAGHKLICADANGPWPAESGTVGLVFGSRVFHLLDVGHVAEEFLRVATPSGATLLTGKVKREKDSVKTLMRKKMRALLSDEGYTPRESERRREELFKRIVGRGGRPMAQLEAATWPTAHRPIDSINGWRGKASMGGVTPTRAVKESVLSKLTEWATATFGDLETALSTQETYIIEGVRSTAEQGI